MTQVTSKTPRQKDDFRRMFTLYLSKTLETKKPHHFGSCKAGTLMFSINFTCEEVYIPESNIELEEATAIVLDLSYGMVTEDLWDYIIKSVEFYCKDGYSLVLSPSKKSIMILTNKVTIILVKEKGISYEAAMSGATIQ